MTMSNEHPDMSGFPDLSIYTCHHCGREVKEDRRFGSELDENLVFCSVACVDDFEATTDKSSKESPAG
jgi:DNA-directed RNA polymerase subunit RPC12/RpoP